MVYRAPHRTHIEEEDLWLRLDWALERAFADPVWAWGQAWQVARDAQQYPEVRRAAEELMDTLNYDRGHA